MLYHIKFLLMSKLILMRTFFIPFCLIFLLPLSLPASAENKHVRVCTDGSAYPPFGWLVDNPDGSQRMEGLAVELMQSILEKRQWTHSVVILPFKRCLRDTANLEMADMILNGSANAEREKVFYVSEPIWSVNIHAFFLREEFPFGLPLHTKTDLQKFRICGIQGHNFSMLGIDESKIDMGSDDYDSAFTKVLLGRCQIFPYNIEVILGYRLLGKDFLDGGRISHQAIPGIPSWPLRMLIAKQFEHAEQLRHDIDDELQQMRSSGELQQRFDRFMQTH